MHPLCKETELTKDQEKLHPFLLIVVAYMLLEFDPLPEVISQMFIFGIVIYFSYPCYWTIINSQNSTLFLVFPNLLFIGMCLEILIFV